MYSKYIFCWCIWNSTFIQWFSVINFLPAVFAHALPGEIISDDEDDEGEGGDEEDEDAYMQKQREKLEAEKEAILNNKNLIAEVSMFCFVSTVALVVSSSLEPKFRK